jgi:RNA polymerase sigma factor (sigma-70 family)
MVTDDMALVQEYAQSNSEQAFGALVSRHVNLVYSVALRQVRDPHLAEEIAQNVFIILSRKAKSLSPKTILSGWLCRTARYISADTLKTLRRRQSREQESQMQSISNDSDPAAWNQIAPLLDEALNCLDEREHDAVVLRFFDGKQLKQVGAQMGTSEDAARMRVNRGLEKLRKFFVKRGVTLSATVITGAVATNSVQAAPAGLAATIAAAAFSGAAITTAAVTVASAATSHAGAHGSNALGAIMATIRTKYATSTLIALLLISAAYLVHRNASLRQELANLRAQTDSSPQTNANVIGAQSGTSDEEIRRLRKEHLELLTLRGRIAQLSRELHARTNSETADQAAQAGVSESPDGDSILFSALVTNRIPSGSALVVGGWHNQQLRAYLVLKPVIASGDNAPEAERLVVTSFVVQAPKNFWSQIGWGDAKSDTRRSTVTGVLTSEQVDTLLQALKETEGATISNESVAKRSEGEYLGIGFATVDDNNEAGTLMSIDVYARIGPDAKSIDLELHPSLLPTNAEIHPSLTRHAQPDRSLSP